MTERERTIKALECCAHVAHMCKECPMDEQRRRYNTGQGCDCWSILADNALTLLAEPEPRVTCSVCKYGRCLSGEWFCFMIGTSRYGKHVTDGDWYCKDAIGR